jgi:hypothetical protein
MRRKEERAVALLEFISTGNNPDRFVSRHWLHTRTGDGRELIVLSGNALVNVRGTSSDAWLRGEMRLGVEIGPGILPSGKWFRADQWVVVVDPSAMWDRDQSVNAGFAVDAFRLISPNAQNGKPAVEISADVAVRDSDAFLYRISYHVTLVGRFVDAPIVE